MALCLFTQRYQKARLVEGAERAPARWRAEQHLWHWATVHSSGLGAVQVGRRLDGTQGYGRVLSLCWGQRMLAATQYNASGEYNTACRRAAAGVSRCSPQR